MAPDARLPIVLLIDDSADDREMYTEFFRFVGLHPLEANSPEEALRVAAEARPHVIVTDLLLPGSMNGLELTRRFRQLPETRAVPIIVLTGSGRPLDREVAFSAGADVFLTKPCLPQTLVDEISRLLRRPRRF
jgi:two-component system, cell cycle response regulator DivK